MIFPARRYVGTREMWDLQTGSQFAHLFALGLREHHSLLDIGCGSLRAGRMLNNYLLPEKYFGIEPMKGLVQDGLKYEVGSLAHTKKPQFDHNSEFDLRCFGQAFEFILAQSIFTHCTQHQVRTCLKSVVSVFKKNGIFAGTYQNGFSDWDGDFMYPMCISYTENFIRNSVQEAGLTFRRSQWQHCVDNGHKWFYATHGREIKQIWRWEL